MATSRRVVMPVLITPFQFFGNFVLRLISCKSCNASVSLTLNSFINTLKQNVFQNNIFRFLYRPILSSARQMSNVWPCLLDPPNPVNFWVHSCKALSKTLQNKHPYQLRVWTDGCSLLSVPLILDKYSHKQQILIHH